MASEIVASLPSPKPFNWAREYGPLWTGSDCTAFWLAPGPDDVLEIDGIRAPLKDHQSGAARMRALDAQRAYQNQLASFQSRMDLAHMLGRAVQ